MTDSNSSKTVRSVCPYCGVGCGIVMQVENNLIVKVTGDRQHPSNFGRLCTKGSTCGQPVANSGRMEHAFMRDERQRDPVRVGIDQAISATAERLQAVIDEHGPDAVALYVSGQMSLEAQYLANKLTKGFLRSRHIESNSRLCMASASSGYKQSLGADGPPGAYSDFEHSDVFLVIGANMADCHPILFLRLLDRVKAGAKLIVVDPRRTSTADKADLYLQIAAGSDLALLNGLLHLLVKNGHTRADFIAAFTEGWEVMPGFLEDYPPQRVAELTGLAESDIRQAAQWLGEAANWMSCWTMGLNQSVQGTWHTNALCNLHLATGAICRQGSGPFSLTGQPNAMGGREMGYMGPGLPGQRSALDAADRAFVEHLWGIAPDSLRAEGSDGTVALFEAMAAGAIKACWIICSNPVASVPNRQKVIEALQNAELVITQDAYLDTETNRYADILLPGALWAEAEGVMINSERNLTLMQQAVKPPGDSLADWQIIARVACAMGFAEAFSYASAAEVFEEIKRAWNPKTGYDIRGASYPRLREQPLQWPCAAPDSPARNPLRYLNTGLSQQLTVAADGSQPALAFATASGKAQFFARPHLPPAELPDDAFPLVLNTGRLQHQWHTLTKTGKVPSLNRLNPGPMLEVHPSDAARLGITEGNSVEIRSRRGLARLPAIISERVRPGNCFAPFHWNDVFGEHLAVNAITSDAVDSTSLQPAFKFCAVSLQAIAAEPLSQQHQPSLAGTAPSSAQQIEAFARALNLDIPVQVQLSADEQVYLQGYLLGLRSAERQPLGVPTLPACAPLPADKRLLLNGLLAGLFSRSDADDIALAQAPLANSTHWLVLWGSQTGNSETLAQTLAQRLSSAGHTARLKAMDEAGLDDLKSAAGVLLVTSTFGDGDPPDNASGFWSVLQGAETQALANSRYSVLALGDSSYDQFCGFGRKLDERLASLGAERLQARLECEPDDQVPAERWMARICAELASSTPTTAAPPARAESSPYSRHSPLRTRVLHNQLLNGPGAEKETRHIAFDLQGHDFPYQAGDALGIWPSNDPQYISALLDTLQLDGTLSVELKDQPAMPLREALQDHLEIARITAQQLQWVSERCAGSLLHTLLSDDNPAPLKGWLWGRQLLDLLREHPVSLSADELVGLLKPLQPRLYSISSSPRVNPHEVHITLSTVRYEHARQPRGGVCSSFLADRSASQPVRIFLQRSTHFHLPQDPQLPLIMIGPGTGIGPFRAFLQEREAMGGTGKNWLFFGEQRVLSDFYYHQELRAWQRSGLLSRLDTAFSRDQAEKIYVQQRMLEEGAQLWRWLEQGAHVYVCGDASRMAKDVDAVLKKIVQVHGRMSSGEAALYVSGMSKERRYLRDVY
ncbi:bifunctional nitrate reductase/sulfite reductase flavoprotein subunit alpha [Pseudomonas fontis]|uniref:Bifunctional nitrate reductase/sulfite reductase flavoprotein subunit alpha n=1 Tax=Pseudomonas fontis TaxID=2942633 RepID=A0ABT5NZW2_9PSED|nr:bifunctional nitrate reductase/sulfite reductase flavoprotein subunit alpha [Pseudomonas fontis]MDD0976370.1 bifunctional nitrate reductase/sulfite reductase flavoprotein subunit alpha [Pseudomonas fontis]MDD0993744.1 bifunctional nitrate reductase/sulfite reductase flavoprotein subunit alpha [Pseudomonas fontis]